MKETLTQVEARVAHQIIKMSFGEGYKGFVELLDAELRVFLERLENPDNNRDADQALKGSIMAIRRILDMPTKMRNLIQRQEKEKE